MTEAFSFHVLTEHTELQAALRLQTLRFHAAGYIDDLPEDGYTVDDFVEHSTYFGALDETGQIVGVSRLILNTPGRTLPALADMELRPFWSHWVKTVDSETIAEVSALAIAPTAGAGVVISRGLYRAMTQHSLLSSGTIYWCAATDTRVIRLLGRMLDLQYEPMGEPAFYRGSLTQPILIDVIGQQEHYRRIESPDIDYYYSGIDIDPDDRGISVRDRSALALPS